VGAGVGRTFCRTFYGILGRLDVHIADKPIAALRQRPDVAPCARVVAERLADLDDALHDRVVGDRRIRPDGPGDLVLADHSGAVFEEQLERLEGFRAEVNLLPIGAAKASQVRPDLDVCLADSEHCGRHQPASLISPRASEEFRRNRVWIAGLRSGGGVVSRLTEGQIIALGGALSDQSYSSSATKVDAHAAEKRSNCHENASRSLNDRLWSANGRRGVGREALNPRRTIAKLRIAALWSG
jgi:hypothetical protein